MTDESIFAAAVVISSPVECAAYLDRACAGDPGLRREVEELLNAHAASNPLDRPPRDFDATGPYVPESSKADLLATGPYVPGTPKADSAGALAAGDRIGPYKLLERIGEGGMGEVWVADQLEPLKRRVALKLIKPGMDSRSVLARFEAERQALALMDHPNIAKVFDAGTTPDGQPFFVMELVKGTPITEFCDARKLTPHQRLELFIPVCAAIQHAHMKGIIHRDIKPGNVLVELHDDKPVAKVIDFGVAKAIGQQLTEKTIYTGFGALVGTPAYMAPEQATFNAVDVDTRADVYALGVVLYELLAGSPPIEKARLKRAALDEVLRIVREEEPPRPSARLSTSETKAGIAAKRQCEPAKLSALLKGEIDWIVMKALEKDRVRRYDTPSGLARDVQRYLSGEAVEACPPTLGYRLHKFYRRNRTAVQVVCAFVLLALGTAVMGTLLAVRATEAERDTAEQRDRAIEAEIATGKQRDRAVEAEIEKGKQRDRAVEAEIATGKQRDRVNDALNKLRLAVEQKADAQYLWDMQLIPVALDAGTSDEARRLLARHVPIPGQLDRRALEWYYWNGQLEPRPSAPLEKVPGSGQWTVSEDGSRLAQFAGSAKEPPVLTVWDVKTRKVVLQTAIGNKPAGGPMAPSLSKDGKRVAVICPDSTNPNIHTNSWRAMDVATGRSLFEQTGVPSDNVFHTLPESCVFSPDGRWLEMFYSKQIQNDQFGIVDLGKEQGPRRPQPAGAADVVRLKTRLPQQCPIAPDGSWVASFFDGRVTVRDLETGKERGWDVPGATGCTLALSPDGRLLAGAVSDRKTNRTLRVWEPATGKEVFSCPLTTDFLGKAMMHAYFSPNGERLAVAFLSPSDPDRAIDVTVWDPRTGRQFPPPLGLRVRDLLTVGYAYFLKVLPKFSPDGRLLVFARGKDISTWDTKTGKPQRTFRGHANNVEECFVSADGNRCLSVEAAGAFREWNLRSEGQLVVPLQAAERAVYQRFFSEDGSRMAVVAPLPGERVDPKAGVFPAVGVQFWDTATGKALKFLIPPPRDPDNLKGVRNVLALNPDGRRAVLMRSPFINPGLKKDVAGLEADLTVWDVDRGIVLFHQKLDAKASYFPLISADGSTVAAIGSGRITGGGPADIRLFDVTKGQEGKPLTLPEVFVSTAFSSGLTRLSPDGRHLAACLRTNFNVKPKTKIENKFVVWDLVRGGQPVVMADTSASVFGGPFGGGRMTWSQDGKRIAVQWSSGPAPKGAPLMRDSTPGVALIDPSTGKVLATTEQPLAGDMLSNMYMLKHLALSPDGRRVAAHFATGKVSGSISGVEVDLLRVWDAETGKLLLNHPLAHSASAQAQELAFSADGHRLMFLGGVAAAPGKKGAANGNLDLMVTTLGEAVVEEPAK